MSSVNYFDLFIANQQTLTNHEMLDFVILHGKKIWRDLDSSIYFSHKKGGKVKPSEYKYLITFTLDPKKVDLKNAAVKSKIEEYIIGILKVPENHRFYYSREHNDTNTHWHCIVHRKTPFVQDKLRYYKKQYGNVDVSRSHDLSDEHSVKYLGKESTINYIK